MTEVHAVIVGIERYLQPGWDVAGPCRNALAAAAWAMSVAKPENIFLFLKSKQSLEKEIKEMREAGVQVFETGAAEDIWSFCLDELPQGRVARSRLVFYWSGHGYADPSGRRIFLCSNYKDKTLTQNVFNASNFLRHLRSNPFSCFAEQIVLADVCGQYSTKVSPLEVEPDGLVEGIEQIAFFATPEGEYAYGNDGQGIFTAAALKVLGGYGQWPDFRTFSERLFSDLEQVGQTPFLIACFDRKQEIVGRRIGRLRDRCGALAKSILGVLCRIEMPDSRFRPLYLRTVESLGTPELAGAQGLTGMIAELASMGDAAFSPGAMPDGLLEFLVRLTQVEELATPVRDWLAENATGENANALATIRERIAVESAGKVLVIDVASDERGQIASFAPFLRTRDLSRGTGPTLVGGKVRDWDDFCTKLVGVVETVRAAIDSLDFEIHLLVEAVLFDRPFHQIPIYRDGSTLGEHYVVVLRHRDRVLHAGRLVREPWLEYASALRVKEPSGVEVIPVAGDSPIDQLRKRYGFCYADFVLCPPSGADCSVSKEKQTLLRLLRMGVPYLYWLHKVPAGEERPAAALGRTLRRWLSELKTLDKLPWTVAQERSAGECFASDGSLLWDDPEFRPFPLKRGFDPG